LYQEKEPQMFCLSSVAVLVIAGVIARPWTWGTATMERTRKLDRVYLEHADDGKGMDAGERAMHDKMAKGLSAFNNPQGTWIDSRGNVRTDW
jgi:hypothetical protein